MPDISLRGQKMPLSPIRKLVPFAEEAKKRGVKIYHLNIGQPDIITPPAAIQAVKDMNDKVIEYSHSAGNESYRRKLAQYYQNIGLDIDFTELLITTGGSEAITFALMSCFDFGDEIIVPEPFYANYNGFGTAAGLMIKPVTSSIHDNFALPPIDEFEELIGPKTKGIIICNPNNPTGYLYSETELLKLRDIVRKHDLYLFVDEVYREFCYDGNEHHSALLLKGIEDNVAVIDSVSKRYSACGVRIGTLISRNKRLIETALKFGQARLSPPSFGQVFAEAALDTSPEYFKKVYDEYISRRNYMVGALNKMKGVICPMPKGAFYTIVHLPVDDADMFSQWMLSDFEYNNETVMMAPGSGFYFTPGLGKTEVRIAYVLNKEDLGKAMKCLEEGLKAYPGKVL
ncbi:MAG: pyridoxal phosphate-dependent aminotransferase [Bacteroidota bacterium]